MENALGSIIAILFQAKFLLKKKKKRQVRRLYKRRPCEVLPYIFILLTKFNFHSGHGQLTLSNHPSDACMDSIKWLKREFESNLVY